MKKKLTIIGGILLLILGLKLSLRKNEITDSSSEKIPKKTNTRKIASISNSKSIKIESATNERPNLTRDKNIAGPIQNNSLVPNDSYLEDGEHNSEEREKKVFTNIQENQNNQSDYIPTTFYSDANTSSSNSSSTDSSDSRIINSGGFFGGYPSQSNNISAPVVSDNNGNNALPKPTHNAPTCSINNTGGTFNEKISLEITCSTNSEIKYCIDEECCDPSSGNTYTGIFQIGESDTTLCVSFSGTSNTSNLSSDTKEHFYTFDQRVPHLEMVQNKSYIQTTQLDGFLTLRSNDYGKPLHTLGVLNLFNHSIQNLSCDEVLSTYEHLSNPLVMFIQPELTIAQYNANEELRLSLPLTHLRYGENNIFGYVQSSVYNSLNYACSNSQLILEDFYASSNLPLDQVNSNDSIILGGFTSQINQNHSPLQYRGPASSTNDGETYQLRTGLMSVFFDQ